MLESALKLISQRS
ncbi:hypothetical protein LINPERPRIM_LOCUS13268 [Linum perenne]